MLSPPLAAPLTTEIVFTSVFCPSVGTKRRLELHPGPLQIPSAWHRPASGMGLQLGQGRELSAKTPGYYLMCHRGHIFFNTNKTF